MLLLLLGTGRMVQAQSPVFFSSGHYANPNNWAQGSAAAMGTVVGTNIHTTTPNGTGFQYFRFYSATTGGTTYEPNGAADILLNNSTSANMQVAGSGFAYYLNIVNAASNVVFKTAGSGTPGTSRVVAFEIQGPVSTVSSVTQSPVASSVVAGAAVTVTANLSAAFSTGQSAYLRYTTNGYATSTVVQMTGAGTVYTASIPAGVNTAGANVSYYVFTSGPSNVAADGSNADFFTINLNNNGGSNYSYIPLNAVVNVAATNFANDASYIRLGDAFTAINNGVHTGVINITITGNTTETVSAVLNASGSGAASYTAISVQPSGGAARSVSGNLAAPLVDLNGADNVTIDGLNTGGNALTLTNTSTSSTAGTSTIRLFGNAVNNTIQNCSIEGSTTTTGSDGVITLGSGTNNGITISNNTIRAAGASLPIHAIYSSATNTATLNNNNIQDYFNPGGNSAGININGSGTGWTITGNRFFQTGARTVTAAGVHRAIYITSGGSYNISNNIIGYASSTQTGTMTYNGGSAGRFMGIDLTLNTVASSVQNNLIGGISLTTTSATSAGTGVFSGICISGGSVNVGTVTGNRVGVLSSGTISITTSGTAVPGATMYGIYAFSLNTVSIQNNEVAAYTLNGTVASIPVNWLGIYAFGSATYNISGNTIGHASTANAVTVGSNGVTTATSTIRGISTIGTGTITIASNTIANLSLTVAASGSGSVDGILYNASSGTCTVSGNSVYSLSANNNFGVVSGINSNNGVPINILKNKIYDLSCSGTTPTINGMLSTGGVGTTINIINNLIGDLRAVNATNIAPPAGIQGISLNTGASIPVNVYYNTVYLTGTGTGTTAFGAAALYTQTALTLTLRNNILINNCTPKGTGRAVAFQRSSTTLTSYAAASNNNLLYAGAPSAANLIFYDGTNSDQTLADFQTRVSTRDNLSVSADLTSAFLSIAGSSANFLHLDPAIANLAESGAVNVAGTTDDVDNNIRQGNVGYAGTGTAPDIGADEFEGITCGSLPTLTSIATAGPYYAGDVITVNGTNLTGVTGATINGVAATIGTITATTIQFTVPGTITTASGNILVTKGAACGFSNPLAFTFSGFITKGGGTGSGNWNTATIWRGDAVPPANAIVIINNGDAVTLDVSADPGTLTINATASLTQQNNSLTLGAVNLISTSISGTLNIDNAAAPVFNTTNRFKSTTVTILSGGVFNNNSGIATAVSISNFNINNGGLYIHNAVGSSGTGAATDLPGTTRTFDVSSTVEFRKWANNSTPAALPVVTWGNLKINVASLSSSWNNGGNVNTIKGNLEVLATGSVQFQPSSTAAYTINVDGDVLVSGGTLTFATSANYTLNVKGNVTVSGGALNFIPSANGGSPTVTIDKSLTVQTGGTVSLGGSNVAVYTIKGDFYITGGNVTTPNNSNTVNITGTATGSTGSFIMSGGSYIPNPSSSSQNYLTIAGDMLLSGGIMEMMASSGSGSLRFSATINGTIPGTTGKLALSGNAVLRGPSSSPITITTTGDFTMSGTSQFIATLVTSSGRNQILNIGGNMNLGAGTSFSMANTNSTASFIRFAGGTNASVSFTNNASSFIASGVDSVVVETGKTLVMNSDWTYLSSTSPFFNVRGTLDLCSDKIVSGAGTFTLAAGATLKIGNINGITAAVATPTGSIRTTVARVFPVNANYEYCGSVAQFTGTGLTGAAALTINNVAGVTLNNSSIAVSDSLVFKAGILTLGTFNISVPSSASIKNAGTGKFVETNSTGELRMPVPTAGLPASLIFPVGNGSNYTPAQFNFTVNSTARNLHVRSVVPRNSNDLSTTDYINNRWWNTDLSVTTGTYTYTSSFTYLPADLVGTAANIRLNRWTGSAWVNDAASSVNTLNNTLNSSTLNETSGPLAATAQWVGRTFRAPAIYRWASAVSGSWLVSTNWNPVGVPGSGDGVIFDPAGPAYTVTNMPTGISLVILEVTNNNQVTLQAGAAGTVSMIPLPNFSGLSPQFQVDAGSGLILSGSNAVNINLPASTTGTVGGSCNLRQASHTITVNDAGALVFSSGGYGSSGIIPASGFSGNPFGATGTNGAVIFQNGSTFETFEGANPFGNAGVSIVTFQTGSLFKYSDPNVATLPSISGRTYANFEYSATKVSNFAAAASAFVCDNLTVSAGTANFSLQGTPGHTIRGNITVNAGTTLTFTPAVAGTVNLNSGATQVISGTGTFDLNPLTTFNIASGTTVSLQKNMGVSGSAILNINGTLICTGENYISSPVVNGTVNLNANGTLQIESVNGINNTLASGNIRSTFFNGSSGHYIYAGNANQFTGNRLPGTINSPGTLTIANTGTNPNDIVTLTTPNTNTPRLNLNAGRFNAGTNGTLVINGGTNLVVGGGGNQLLSGTANDNIIRFASNGAVQGTPELYNITIGTSGGGVDFTNNARINGIFLINNLGAVNPNAPRYATGSTLIYNPGGAFIRNVEWGSNTPGAPSYPHHVIVRNGTTLSFTGTTPANIGCGGDLSIGHIAGLGNGVLDLSAVGAIPLNIGGNLNIGGASTTGSLIMSNTSGGDINLTGNWTRTANGTVNFGSGNGRAVYFVGNTDATITAAGGQQFPFVFINKNAKATKVTLADHVSITDMISFTQGTVDMGTNNKFLTILSTATKTARVGQSSLSNTDFIYGSSDNTGQFIVQRYLPARRSWRLMAAPLKPGGGTHTIAQAWQERSTGLSYTAANWVASVATDTSSAGFATQITGGTLPNGFDESNNNSPSIRYFSSGSWLAPANTNNTSVNSQEGWMLFVRGDREIYGEITNQYKTPTITTLRPRGQVFIGPKSVTSSGMTTVGNPYASAVDYFTMVRTGSGWPANPTYYMWDPYLGGAEGVGAFVALTWNGTGFTRSAPLTGTGTSSIDNRVIPSGAAIMVDFPAGGGTLSMGETDKKDSATTVAFRPLRRELMTVLNTRNADGSTFVSDGTLSMFDESFSNEADVNDVRKLSNFTAELIGLSRNGTVLAMERKALNPDTDTLFYFVNRLQRKNYQLELSLQQLDLPAHTTAFIEDAFLNSKTPVHLFDTTRYNFSVTADAASAANNRFRLVFRRSTWFTGLQANVLHQDILVEWTVKDEFNIGQYEIERSSDGIHFAKTGTVEAGSGSDGELSYHWLDQQPRPGTYFYRIRSISKTGAVTLSDTVKVRIVKASPALYVFPNPVSNHQIQLQLNSAASGVYQVKLLANNGQALLQTVISHAGGTATHIIQPGKTLASGVYRLQVLTPEGKQEMIPVVIVR